MRPVLNRIIQGEDLSFSESYNIMNSIMSGKHTDVEIAGFLTGLAVKGETAAEIAGCATAMREKMVQVSLAVDAVDMCGTGGDGVGTFNISTAASFVVAGAGVPVAKHGNRSISSRSGSADVLTALGVDIDMDPETTAKCIESIGVGFFYAPKYHPAMKYVMPARRGLRVRTVFNILGPLCNPAGVSRQVIGLFDGNMSEKLAEVMKMLGSEHVLLVHGEDGMDEITATSGTKISRLNGSQPILSERFHPEKVGYSTFSAEEFRGGTPEENARIIRNLLDGQPGPRRDVVVLNAAAGLVVGEKATDMQEGVHLAEESIETGRAREVLDQIARA